MRETSDVTASLPQPDASEIWMPPLPSPHPDGVAKPRIGICGISIESSTFSPHVSGAEAFTRREGQDLLDFYSFLQPADELTQAAEWRPLVHFRSLPGGAVDPDFYQEMKDAIHQALHQEIEENGPLDGLFFDIHGAMSVAQMWDAEGDLADMVRNAVGPQTLITTSMDLHGNVSRQLLEAVDLITCYRMAPHEDYMNTKERAVWNLLDRLRGEHGRDPQARRVYKAWVPVPVLLPGEKTSTRLDPAASLYAELPRIEAQPGITDASIWIGYAWADEPRCMAYVVVTGDDGELAAREAEALGRQFWDARGDFRFVGPAMPLDQAVDRALASSARPFVISDSGDNPTAGGTGDVTWTVSRLLERPGFVDAVRAVHASMYDGDAVASAFGAGLGAEIVVDAGARVDGVWEGPVTLRGEVYSLSEGDEVAGRQAVIRVGPAADDGAGGSDRGLYVIVTERRKPFHHLEDFRSLGLDPESFDVVFVKIGYLEPELYALADGGKNWIMALTPGGVDQDLLRLGHSHLAPGVFPFEDVEEPVGGLRAAVHRRD